MNMESKRRVQVEFSADAVKALDAIRDLSDMKSNTDIIKNAVRLLLWYVTMSKKGMKFQLVRPDNTVKEIEFLF